MSLKLVLFKLAKKLGWKMEAHVNYIQVALYWAYIIAYF